MSRVGDPSGGGARPGGYGLGDEAGRSQDRAGRDRDLAGNPSRQDKTMLGDRFSRDMRFNQFEFGSESRDRENAFQDKVRQALRDATHTPGDGTEEEKTRLLAVAGAPAPPAGVPLPSPADAPVDGTASRADRTARIDALARGVEDALQASLRDGAGRASFSMHLDLAALGLASDDRLGIAGITVTLAPDAVDVVLTRAGEAAAPELVAAVQALAERLHQRFNRRVVRVHEAEPAAAPSAATDGMEGIASLFRRGDAPR